MDKQALSLAVSNQLGTKPRHTQHAFYVLNPNTGALGITTLHSSCTAAAPTPLEPIHSSWLTNSHTAPHHRISFSEFLRVAQAIVFSHTWWFRLWKILRKLYRFAGASLLYDSNHLIITIIITTQPLPLPAFQSNPIHSTQCNPPLTRMSALHCSCLMEVVVVVAQIRPNSELLLL